MSSESKYIKQVTNPVYFRFYSLIKLPMVFLAGVTVRELSKDQAVTSLKYSYLTKNPFRSVYFACLGMAAELSSGVLAMMHIRDAKPKVSMLVVAMQADFRKKATGRIFFSCTDGAKIAAAIAETQKTGEGITVNVKAVGKDTKGDEVAEFMFTWSFRRKS